MLQKLIKVKCMKKVMISIAVGIILCVCVLFCTASAVQPKISLDRLNDSQPHWAITMDEDANITFDGGYIHGMEDGIASGDAVSYDQLGRVSVYDGYISESGGTAYLRDAYGTVLNSSTQDNQVFSYAAANCDRVKFAGSFYFNASMECDTSATIFDGDSQYSSMIYAGDGITGELINIHGMSRCPQFRNTRFTGNLTLYPDLVGFNIYSVSVPTQILNNCKIEFFQTGILLAGEVINLEFANNIIWYNTEGVRIDSDGGTSNNLNRFVHNTIYANDYGVIEESTASGNRFEDNAIDLNNDIGILCTLTDAALGPQGTVISGNWFEGSTTTLIKLNGTASGYVPQGISIRDNIFYAGDSDNTTILMDLVYCYMTDITGNSVHYLSYKSKIMLYSGADAIRLSMLNAWNAHVYIVNGAGTELHVIDNYDSGNVHVGTS